MDDHTIRITNLRAIANLRFGGKQAALASHLQRQPDYISRLFRGTKKLGADLAREFERLLELPKFALDNPNGIQSNENLESTSQPVKVVLPEDIQAIVNLMLAADDDGRKRIRIYAEDAFYEYQKRKDARDGKLEVDSVNKKIQEKLRLASSDPAFIASLDALTDSFLATESSRKIK